MATTLTERYIAEAISGIPAATRNDVEAELNVSIADAIEARTDRGEEHANAEKAVLTDLGDPGMLAARYSDRPLYLIGPRVYLTWWRLLKLLWAIVPAAAMGGVALGQALAEAPFSELMGSVIATGFGAFLHTTFWVTLVFVVLERTKNSSAIDTWDVNHLREIPSKTTGRGEMIASLAFLFMGIVVLLWDQLKGLVVQGGVAYPFLNPGLWPWWITGLMVLMAAQTALVIAVYLNRRHGPAFAIINTALALSFAVPATALLSTGQLVNPEFVTAVFTVNGVDAGTLRTLAILIGAGIVGFSAWGIIDGWIKAFRDNRR
jgi:hypothetical protein